MTDPYVGRLAPSPTGALHLGNARTFLIVWLRCRAMGGRLLLRMEDLDHPKVKPEAVEGAYEDLRWLGLDWDEGPDVGGPSAPYVQSERLDRYTAAFDRLRDEGRLYPCTCTRRDVEAAQAAPHADEELRYPGTCRERWKSEEAAREATGREPAWRFRVAPGESSFVDAFSGEDRRSLEDWSGDFVVARSRDRPAYQLAVVVDDAVMEVTEVIRADDLLASTHRQLALYDALALAPPGFLHVPLVKGEDGRRLAKRHGDTRIASFRRAGLSAARIVGWLAATCGWATPGEELTPAALVPRFDLATLPPDPVIVGPAARSSLSL